MCAHFTLFTDDQIAEIQEIVRIVEKKTGQIQPADIWPGYLAPVLLPAADKRLNVKAMKWGYPEPRRLKGGGVGAIQYRQNAKIETAHSISLWKDSYENRRCLIPATTFEENQRDPETNKNIAYTFFRPGTVLYIAGFWETRPDGKDYFCMLTTEPNETVGAVHSRMPLVLLREELGIWFYGDYDSLAGREHITLQKKVVT